MYSTCLPRCLSLVLTGWLLGATTGCGLQKDVDVDLPASPAELVVECYLENNVVPRLTVTESVPYLSAAQPTVLTDVTVVLTLANGSRDTLQFTPGIDRTTRKTYTHIGRRRLVARPGDTFGLEVYDSQGRRVTGTATMPVAVPINMVEWKFADQQGERKAYLLMRFQDDAATTDFYRFQVHRRFVHKDTEADLTVNDRLTNGQLVTLGTSYRFRPSDTVVVSLYHVDQPTYTFWESVDDARSANGNPLAQPAAIQSTVQGGLGVFAVLSYNRRELILLDN